MLCRLSSIGLFAFACVLNPGSAWAQSDDELIQDLKAKLKINGAPIDEGQKNNRNNVGTGSVVSWNTYPGEIYIEAESGDRKWKGRIVYHFSGRERKADYVLNVQRDTNDTQASGRVTADYEFTRGNKVLITDVQKEGGRGRVGNAVESRVRGLNGIELR